MLLDDKAIGKLIGAHQVYGGHPGAVREFARAIEAAARADQRERDAEDARRYRWLVENACTGSLGFGDWWINGDEPESEWDAAIDAARAAEAKGAGK